MRLVTIAVALVLAGCNSAPREAAVSAERVLATPYSLRLSVRPESARPGEDVTVIAEFANTGGTTLWVPRKRELFPQFRQKGAGGGSWASSCDGIRYVRLRPGQSARYEIPFHVPALDAGTAEIYLPVRPDIAARLTIIR